MVDVEQRSPSNAPSARREVEGRVVVRSARRSIDLVADMLAMERSIGRADFGRARPHQCRARITTRYRVPLVRDRYIDHVEAFLRFALAGVTIREERRS
jgi:hypothetical protein